MNASDYIQLLRKPENIRLEETTALETLIGEYPFFQSARALHLRGLSNLNSFRYNDALKKTAAHTTDRTVLFDLITSKEFLQNRIAKTIANRKTNLGDIEVNAQEIRIKGNTLVEQTHLADEQDAERILDPSVFIPVPSETEQQLGIGTPLTFGHGEKHSFSEWLKLSSCQPVARETAVSSQKDKNKQPAPAEISRKFKLIDKFIKNNPKIVPRADRNKEPTVVNLAHNAQVEQEELMTETLARVYLEQKRYKNAIQAYKILSLKYPEKSGFFADQIKAVKKLQQNS
ncbi:hypothetical protein [Sinomicrobium soli]|uniref:hypothetical protein n=1 Tax=Sinomicrobium sp. N-1-3-6 TaxID=2219864 RepID=UPI000DCB6DDC|nr:hypothetical protein [Sinomicrobium sp. N-1-3-6]RAV30857.1 hypothetical protein DN748_00945 [Sinomicrobium sp. N-1-3-6]